jgi:hypothetical protein
MACVPLTDEICMRFTLAWSGILGNAALFVTTRTELGACIAQPKRLPYLV